jgi:hypothetical protein
MAVGAGLVFWAWLRGQPFKGLVLAGIGVALYLLVIDRTQTYDRWTAWVHAWGLYKQHWLMGSGIGHWKVVMKQLPPDWQWWTTAHNEFVQGVFEMGIGFALIVAGYVHHIWKRGVRSYRERFGSRRGGTTAPMGLCLTALVIIAVNSLVNFPFHIAITGFLAVTWMALFEVQLRDVA